MPVGSKYVATDPVFTWTAEGSTTVIDLAPYGRDFNLDESMDSADATGYGNNNRQYQPTIGDAGANATILLEDGYVIEDALTKGARGTLIWGPNGSTATNKKITIPVFVSNRSRHWPYDDVATMDAEWQPTGDLTEGVYP